MRFGLLRRLDNLPAAVKASFAFFFSSVVTSGIAYITTPVYTRILTTDEYGQVSVFLTWLQLFGIVAMFCLSMGVFNNGMVDFPDRRDEYSFSILILSNIITILFTIFLFSVYPLIKPIIGMSHSLLFLMTVIFLFQPAYNFWVARQRYEYKYKFVVFWAIINALISPSIAIIACIYHSPGDRLYPRLFGAEVPLIVVYIAFHVYLGRKANFEIDKSFWKPALMFNLPLIPHYLSSYLLNSSDKIMISRLVSDSATAYYSVAYSVAAVAFIFWGAVNGSLIPYTYEKCKEKDFKGISNVVVPILMIFALFCLLIIMLAPEVVAIMATKSYQEAIYVIPPIIGGVFFQVQYYIYANVVYYYKRPKYLMYASVIATVLNIALNYCFIKQFGYLAAGYTTLICFIVQAAIDYFAMRKVVKEDVYNMKYVSLLSITVIIVALISNTVYDYPLIRYGIISIIVLLAIIKRGTIFDMFMNIRKN